jgi:hypothetical protein
LFEWTYRKNERCATAFSNKFNICLKERWVRETTKFAFDTFATRKLGTITNFEKMSIGEESHGDDNFCAYFQVAFVMFQNLNIAPSITLENIMHLAMCLCKKHLNHLAMVLLRIQIANFQCHAL